MTKGCEFRRPEIRDVTFQNLRAKTRTLNYKRKTQKPDDRIAKLLVTLSGCGFDSHDVLIFV